MAFKGYNAREETTEASHKARLRQKAELQASLLNHQTQALVAALLPATGSGPQKPPPGGLLHMRQRGTLGQNVSKKEKRKEKKKKERKNLWPNLTGLSIKFNSTKYLQEATMM